MPTIEWTPQQPSNAPHRDTAHALTTPTACRMWEESNWGGRNIVGQWTVSEETGEAESGHNSIFRGRVLYELEEVDTGTHYLLWAENVRLLTAEEKNTRDPNSIVNLYPIGR